MPGIHLNLIQQGHMWSLRSQGIQRDDFTIMVLEEGIVYCDIVEVDDRPVVQSSRTHSPHSEPLDLSTHQQICSLHYTRSQMKPDAGIATRTWSKSLIGSNQ